ncbi:bifunctional phosphoribosyl-AMP cyclohydrolase/phosphoribosyl-ATP diphosphatase HisIE [Robiginitomaculum antarcticum]|uniref:bifunctional phosphoribosyl-AMP cyclohydrolase/phosphoribosyl-ATP diphosphatase HisIE n=1 Tax=Robiginitomaculum antarcticum TaxID=437507 RepID=UPI0003823E54|nr:bifunctional phosphoribosyl-AMP cyclohydrolase/phosphoribosyl-ATP diphosphatase HisIE [Robiginitomaculum antarcticum]
MKIDFEKGGGLVPAIVQDADSGQVLMLGYMNETAVEKTTSTGLVTFYSRSREMLWTKGETSGNTLELVDMTVDCDNDTLLVMARPNGPTCHNGTVSCFAEAKSPSLSFLGVLENVIKSRQNDDKTTSYTAKLLSGPLHKISQKVGEEGVETALAAVAEDDEALKNESADLIYHLMVLLRAKDIHLADIVSVLQSRHR